jgi:putative intracellular protease/amidase
MSKNWFIGGGIALIVLSLAGFGGWVASLPAATAVAEAPPVPQQEVEATLVSLKPVKRERPLVAVIGINAATETNDYLMPYGILRRADVADVMALSTGPGPVQLYPALSVEPDATIAEFDAQFPEGADYVVVPAMEPNDDPVALAWIRAQADKGAIVIGVCAGAVVVAHAGLLDGKKVTTHWYYRERLHVASPTAEYVPDRRFVVDGRVVTTTGITASLPTMLTLIEAIAGRDKAQEVAEGLGLANWDARHASAAFRFNRPFALTVLGNAAAFWNREEFGITLKPGIDEVALAVVAASWSRTYRSRAVTIADEPGAVETLSGLRILPDQVAPGWPVERKIADFGSQRPVEALDQTLQAIATRYGAGTASVVAMQLEYPSP